MSMTTTPTLPIPKPRLGSWLRRNLTWVFVALAVATTIGVAALVVVGLDSGTDVVREPSTEVDAGAGPESLLDESIVARDHATSTAGTNSLLDRSIVARDHATATAQTSFQDSIVDPERAAQIGRDHQLSRDVRMLDD